MFDSKGSKIQFGGKEQVQDEELKLSMKLGLVMDKKLYDQMLTYIQAIDFECSGLGNVSMEDGVLTLNEISLPKQTGQGGGTELDAEAVSSMMTQEIKKGHRKAQNFWWHSHVNMGTFWSGIDDDNCERLSAGNGFLVSVVGVQSGAMRCRFDISKPFRLTIDEIPIYVSTQTTNGRVAKGWKDQVAKNVKRQEIAVQYPTNGYHNYPSYYGGKLYTPRKDWKQPSRFYVGELGTNKLSIMPTPTRTQKLNGAIVDIPKHELIEYKDSEHNVWCHAHRLGIECEECLVANCFSCARNGDKVNSEVSQSVWGD